MIEFILALICLNITAVVLSLNYINKKLDEKLDDLIDLELMKK